MMMAKQSMIDRGTDAASTATYALGDLSSPIDDLLAVQTEIQKSYDAAGEALQQTERGQRWEAAISVDVGKAKELLQELEVIVGEAEDS
jgi:hypothetical protein